MEENHNLKPFRIDYFIEKLFVKNSKCQIRNNKMVFYLRISFFQIIYTLGAQSIEAALTSAVKIGNALIY